MGEQSCRGEEGVVEGGGTRNKEKKSPQFQQAGLLMKHYIQTLPLHVKSVLYWAQNLQMSECQMMKLLLVVWLFFFFISCVTLSCAKPGGSIIFIAHIHLLDWPIVSTPTSLRNVYLLTRSSSWQI